MTILVSSVAACSSDAAEPTPLDPAIVSTVENLGDDPPGVLLDDPNSESTIAPSEVSDPVIEPQVTSPMLAVLPEGFTTAIVEITEADGTVCEVCMWLADTAQERGQGLMGVTSLGTPRGMAFVWPEPTAGSFFMFQTVTPLSIAWFGAPATDEDDDEGGALVATADMEPCPSENSAECERFAAGGDYVLAIEVFQGDLASIGITDGATARVLPGTEATDCPVA